MQKQNRVIQQIEPQKIINAFDIILNSSNPKQLIKQADTFIHECENNPQFALTLMEIFAKVNNQQTQWQALIHLSNVIKRNWTTKRRSHQTCYMSEDTKNKIKNGLVELYKYHWQTYYKQFNQMFKFLAKYEFPANYPSLKNFIIEILSTLANSDIQVLIAPSQLLPYLSLVKTVFKQNSNRRYMHTKESYYQHISQSVKLSMIIQNKINNTLNSLKNMNKQQIDRKMANKLLQCSRKIDKIILYCLQCAVSNMQTDNQICQIIQYMINKIEMLISMSVSLQNIQQQQIQLNIYAILQGISKLQSILPFSFANILQKYLHLLINLLLNNNFKNEKLINCVITSNTKPLITFAYYTNQIQFKQSIQCKKGISSNYCKQQLKCHQQFIKIYGNGNASSFMQKSITQLLTKYRNINSNMNININQDDVMFQDTENHDTTNQYNSFELFLILLKNLISRFKQQFKIFNTKILQHLLTNKISSSQSNISINMYEIILLLPKVYDETNLNLDKIFQLIQLVYINKDYIIFSRLIRNYNSYLNMSMVIKSFQILINMIATPNIDHKIMYQCAICIKKILNQHQQQELPLYNLGLCLANLLSLVTIYKDVPTNLWNLLQLITEIMKLVSNQAIINNLHYIIQSIQILINMKDNQQLVISAISDLLQNVLQFILPQSQYISKQINSQQMLQYLYEISIKLVGMHIYNSKLENPQILYKLWLAVVRNVQVQKCSQNLLQKLVNALHTLKNKIMKQDTILFLQLVQEYIIKNMIKLSDQNIISISNQVLNSTEFQCKNRTIMYLFSMYFSYFCVTGNFIDKMLILAMQTIKQLINKISQQNNILRSFVMLVINHHIIVIGPQKMFSFFTQNFNNNFIQWFWPFIWSLQYVNHKYACKVSSIAMLSSLQVLQNANILTMQIQESLPLEKIMKAVSFQVEPINMTSAVTAYSNAFKMMGQGDEKRVRSKIGYAATKSIPLKYKLHLRTDWAQCDLTGVYMEKFLPIISNLGWNMETIDQRFDKTASIKIISLLSGNSQIQNSINQ